MTNQFELTSTFCVRPQQFAWFLGAGASAVAGLPTATDIIWDLKRRYYCREENQEITRQDVQIEGVRARIQDFMASKGFPKEGDPREYTTYFEKIFGDNKERQRQYLTAILSEERVTLSIGNRILAGLLVTEKARAVFTTNFDSVLERAIAEAGNRALAAYHLEGAASANKALSNEEYPFYCKLHGDFRYESVKNLSSDLAAQNADLSKALLNAANRFGFIVAGYSGRDESVMELLRSALSTPNPFPHGLYWTAMKNARVLAPVRRLIDAASKAGVDAALVEVETFDALMLRLWRNIHDKDATVNAKALKSRLSKVAIPVPVAGNGQIVRMNALRITSLPGECHSLTFRAAKEWHELREITRKTEGLLLFTKAEAVLCWGKEVLVRSQFKDLVSIERLDLSPKIKQIERNQHVKGFLEEALCRALVRGKPLLARTTRRASYLVADPQGNDQSVFHLLQEASTKIVGEIPGLLAPTDEFHPTPETVSWAEAVRVSIEITDGRYWLVLDPDIWIWPPRARKIASEFLDARRGGRYNRIYNQLIDAWLAVVLGDADERQDVTVSACGGDTVAEAPSFSIGARTAYSRRLTA